MLGKAGKKLFAKHLEQYAPADPLYETYTNERGKKKQRKRAPPPGLSARDVQILKSVQKRAHYLDKGFSICGMRFGWAFIIGLLPLVGDFADIGLNYYLVLRKARQADLPGWLVRRMLTNNLVSAGVGFVPVAGDVVLAMYKANSRNAALLEEFLRIRGEEYIKLHGERDNGVKKGPSIFKKLTTGGKSEEGNKGSSSKADQEQVKPGAGMAPGEVPVDENTEDTPPLASTSSQNSKGPKKNFTSLFGSKKSSLSPPAGDRGRFVEDVDPQGSSSDKKRSA
jgi:hypothetical protein